MTFPIDRFLVPERDPGVLPGGFTEVRQQLLTGLPHRLDLGSGVHAMLVLPTGLARQWLTADPLDVVSTSDDDITVHAPGTSERAPLRLVVRRDAAAIASVPLAAGQRRVCGPVELAVLSWRVCAGTVRGPGDFGSFVAVGWRAADRAVDVFSAPPTHALVLRRREALS